MSRWGCVALVAIACGHPPPPTPPSDPKPVAIDAGVLAVVVDAPTPLADDLPRLAQRALEMFRAWQTALVEANEDCAVAATKINALADTYADVIAANRAVERAGHERRKALKAALEPYDADFAVAAEGIAHSKTMAACAGDPAFARAIDRMGGDS